MKLLSRKNFILTIILLTTSCLKYDTDLNSIEKINVTSLAEIKRGEACSHNLFGGFSIPYVGETAIKLFGDQSVISAIKIANITRIYAIDKYSKNYFFYSKRCTIVFGK
ncbi:MAG: hypothetical protein FJX30_00830 [Alphaproteobacteria bacterium]|nr:hypothetical protein [Alphaproteobacteria bacterium]